MSATLKSIGSPVAVRSRDHRPVCRCCGSEAHYWVLLSRILPPKRYWWRRNLAQTRAVLAADPSSPVARRLLDCWPERIKRALMLRYPAPANGGQDV